MMLRTALRSVVVSAALVVGLAGALHAQTAEELVDKNLKAKGGVEKLKAVEGMRVTGRVMLPAAGTEFPVTIMTKPPNRFYQQSIIQGQKIQMGFDGDKAWMVNPMYGATTAQEIKGQQLEALKSGIDIVGPLVNYKEKGTVIEAAGTDTVDGRPVHKLKILPKTGPTVFLFLDDETGLEAKSVIEVAAGGAEQPATTLEVLFSNYKTEGGITMPHTIEQKLNGQAMQIMIDKVEVSPQIDDAIFRMPMPPAAEVKPGQ